MSLVLKDIRHSYGGGVIVVDGASVSAAPGEIVCLFGPSGCGKTTLLRIAAGLEPVQAGVVEIDGAVAATPGRSTPPQERRLGFVFQDFVLFPHLTIAENVAFGLGELPASARAERVSQELDAVGLHPFKDRFPHELSGGQQQRAALARAFARRPRAMLLDEPFASIDVALRRKLRAEMRRLLKARSTPAILVTHDPAEAIELGDRIAVMREGRIVETAAPETLFQSPATLAGATIFPGAQAFECEPIEGGVETAFGSIAPLMRPAGAKMVVVHEGGVRARADRDGPLSVVDCRFSGPDWTVTLSGAGERLVRAVSHGALSVGEAASVTFDPGAARLVAS